MKDSTFWVGLDGHADSVMVSVFGAERGASRRNGSRWCRMLVALDDWSEEAESVWAERCAASTRPGRAVTSPGEILARPGSTAP